MKNNLYTKKECYKRMGIIREENMNYRLVCSKKPVRITINITVSDFYSKLNDNKQNMNGINANIEVFLPHHIGIFGLRFQWTESQNGKINLVKF